MTFPIFRSLAVAVLAASSAAQAALVFQAGSPSYTIDRTGATTAAVDIYVAETSGTTLSGGGGVNSIKFVVAPASSSAAPTLTSIAANAAFNGARISDLSAGSLYLEMASISAGVPLANGRVYLGTLSYAGYASVAATTTFSIRDALTSDAFNANGDAFDAELAAGSFNVSVPEPSSMVVAAGACALLVRRRAAR